MRIRIALQIFIFSLVTFLAAGRATAQRETPPPAMPCSGANLVDQKFPTSGPEITHWRLCWQTMNGNGLLIHWAYFRTSPTKPWIFLLWDSRISEIFVPYHSGNPSLRYLDVTLGFPLTSVGPQDCPASQGGTVLAGNVCKQVHDRGISWKADSAVYRGEELVLWSALAAANYNYIMEWTFRDDGIVMGRVGATSHNLPNHEGEAHMHNPIWRLDVHLNGWPNDSVALGTHTETELAATDTEPLISKAKGLLWNPRNFNSLDVTDKFLKNGNGKQTMYQLMPLPTAGLAQHQEPFSVNDFWVTLYNPAEMSAKDLVSYVAGAQSVSNADVVLWYRGSVHHVPRDEDGEVLSVNGRREWHGVALIMWTGFMLKPHDLFDKTPFYP